jgi:pyruvate/2-oxoglutarate dehydrogenase complex dihydrolipoamide acyltransferase (E2) component
MQAMPTQVTIPLLNPNEPEAVLAALHVREGQQVAVGDLLCTLETTKSAADLTAEQAGYVTGLRGQQGQIMQAGERLCYLAEEPGWTPPTAKVVTPEAQTPAGEEKPPEGLRITQPALTLAIDEANGQPRTIPAPSQCDRRRVRQTQRHSRGAVKQPETLAPERQLLTIGRRGEHAVPVKFGDQLQGNFVEAVRQRRRRTGRHQGGQGQNQPAGMATVKSHADTMADPRLP